MVAAPIIPQDCWLPIEIVDHYVNKAIVVDISESDAPAHAWCHQRGTTFGGNFAKRSVMLIVEQQHALTISSTHAGIFHLRIDMAVDGENVRPAIVVVIEKPRSPADIGSANRRNFGGI